jgi:thioredoxin reductase
LLGGLALIRIATEQGVQAVDAIAADLAEQDASDGDPDLLDLLIVGAGPAGLAAALRAKQRRLHYLVIDQDSIGGTVSKYPRRKLTLTGSLSLPLHGEVRKQEFVKEELVQFFEELVLRYELSIQPGVKLNEVHGHRNDFHVQTSQGSLRARRLLLALGKRGTPRRLGIPGEQLEKVLYQLVDAATYTDQHVLVVGGGDSAIEAATALANQPGNSVTLSYRREHFFRLKSRNRERIERYQGRIRILYQSELQQVHPKHVSIATPEGSEQLRNDSVFILAGGEPPLPLLRQIGVRLGGDDEPVESQPVPEDVAVLS